MNEFINKFASECVEEENGLLKLSNFGFLLVTVFAAGFLLFILNEVRDNESNL